MFKRMKNIKLSALLIQLFIALCYPAFCAYRAETNRFLAFSNALFIISLLLLLVGVIYSFVLHGDFDLSAYYLRRGLRPETMKDYAEYKQDREEARAGDFNYPLFLGIVLILFCFASSSLL